MAFGQEYCDAALYARAELRVHDRLHSQRRRLGRGRKRIGGLVRRRHRQGGDNPYPHAQRESRRRPDSLFRRQCRGCYLQRQGHPAGSRRRQDDQIRQPGVDGSFDRRHAQGLAGLCQRRTQLRVPLPVGPHGTVPRNRRRRDRIGADDPLGGSCQPGIHRLYGRNAGLELAGRRRLLRPILGIRHEESLP